MIFLYGVFAVTDEDGVPLDDSALCAFPIKFVNKAIESGVKACCSSSPEQLSRGLCYFQTCESCPHEVSQYEPISALREVSIRGRPI